MKRALSILFSLCILSACTTKAPTHRELDLGSIVTAPVLDKKGYRVCYDGKNRVPFWVWEEITADRLNQPTTASRRRSHFHEESKLPAHIRSELEDYRRSGYDRGHLAAAANHKESQEELNRTFSLINIAPQEPHLNQVYWRKLEEDVREWAQAYDKLYTVSGPLFLPDKGEVAYPVLGENSVGVPTHFYKLIVFIKGKDYSFRCFVMPNRKFSSKTPLEQFEVSLLELERVSGTVFFDKIPNSLKAKYK